MSTHVASGLAVLMIGFLPLSPAPTNPLCYNDPAYRDTHEQECLIDQVAPAPFGTVGSGFPGEQNSGGSGPGRSGLGGLLHGLTGGLL